jgi:alpha-tubulin suppressor-like RCC1 family protein
LAILENGSVWAWGISNYGVLGNPSGNVQLVPFYHLVNETPLVPRVAYVSPLPGSPLYTKPVSLRAYFSRRIQIDTINSQNITLHDDSNNPVDFRLEPTQACVDIITTAPLQLGKTYTLKLSNFVDVYGTSMSLPYTYNFQVELPFPAWQSTVSAGAAHSLAQLERVYAWGDNSSGQLGDGTTIGRTMPVAVQGLPNRIEFLAAGGGHSLAILPDSTVVAWGDNSAGQLGDGSNVNKSTVLPVPQLTDIVAVAAGTNHSLALKKDGTVWAWGANSSGQVGDGYQSASRHLTTLQQWRLAVIMV